MVEHPKLTLKQQAVELLEEFKAAENSTKTLCLMMHDLHLRFVTELTPGSFFDWLEELGFARGSAYNYLNAGYALKAGLDDGTRTLTELYDLGSAMRNGATKDEAAKAPDPAKLAEAKRTQGLVKLSVPLLYAGEAESLAERIIRLGMAPAKPEAIGLGILGLNLLSDTELSSLLERIGG